MILSDNELLNELKLRFDENKKSLQETQKLLRELEAVNQKLVDSESLKSHFLSNIRNEINNPLSAIIGLAENLSTLKNPDKKLVGEITNSIISEAFNLNFQLCNIFAAAELEAGETDLMFSAIDVNEMINDILDDFSHQFEERKQKIVLINNIRNQPDTRFTFRTDAEKLHLILSNLISNATKFGLSNTEIIIKVGIEEKKLFCSVFGSCNGIKSGDRNKIFDRFKQLETGSTKKFSGHGLGLSIIKAFLELLNGEISIDTEIGRGCTFKISIPEPESAEYIDAYSFEGNEILFEQGREF